MPTKALYEKKEQVLLQHPTTSPYSEVFDRATLGSKQGQRRSSSQMSSRANRNSSLPPVQQADSSYEADSVVSKQALMLPSKLGLNSDLEAGGGTTHLSKRSKSPETKKDKLI